ncbi:MAG TPA: toll/interleukin-1 receptor domain-containing protein, partial [Silvibacterium sp.]|nr:toll/interleukin-1 receptor domain-containing protein [Silvibacterium sp.]
MTQRTLKIFLCHSSSDKAFVRELYKRVKSEGFEPWLDEECLLPGQDRDLEIRKAVRASDIVVVCLSRSSVSKEGYIQKEIRAALDCADEKLDGSIFIVPLRLDDCNVPNRLSRWHWVNFFEDGGWEKLFRALASRSRDLEGSFDPTLPTVASAP